MNPTQPLSKLDEFKVICSGINCDRKPTTVLRIKYLRKVGKFCKLCAADLIKEGLVEEVSSSEEEFMVNG